MRRVVILLLTSVLILSSYSVIATDAASISVDWEINEGDYIDFRFISEGGMYDDQIIKLQVDSPLPDMFELPPGAFGFEDLNDWTELPEAPVTGYVTSGGVTTDFDDFTEVFSFGGVAAGYWCRFALPTGIPLQVHTDLVLAWISGPHGPIVVQERVPSVLHQYRYWGFEYGFQFSDTIYNVSAWYWQQNMVLANITIVGHDAITEEQTHHLMMVSDYIPPEIYSSSGDVVSIEFGTTDETVEWRSFDYLLSTYDVLRNGTSIQTGIIDDDNDRIRVSLDGFEVGAWNLTAIVTDYLGRTVNHTIIVTVTPRPGLAIDPMILVGGVGAVAVILVVVVVIRRR